MGDSLVSDLSLSWGWNSGCLNGLCPSQNSLPEMEAKVLMVIVASGPAGSVHLGLEWGYGKEEGRATGDRVCDLYDLWAWPVLGKVLL